MPKMHQNTGSDRTRWALMRSPGTRSRNGEGKEREGKGPTYKVREGSEEREDGKGAEGIPPSKVKLSRIKH